MTSAQMISGIQDLDRDRSRADDHRRSACERGRNCRRERHTNGNWTGAPTGYAYQWKRDGGNIVGATAATYTMVGADTGHQIGCCVGNQWPRHDGMGPLSKHRGGAVMTKAALLGVRGPQGDWPALDGDRGVRPDEGREMSDKARRLRGLRRLWRMLSGLGICGVGSM